VTVDNDIMKDLNDAFSKECNDVFMYLKEADKIRRKVKNGEKLAKKFEELSKEELRHADRIAMEIVRLGGNAKWEFTLPEPDDSLRNILRLHLKRNPRLTCFIINYPKR